MERKLRWNRYSKRIWFLIDDETCDEELQKRASVELIDNNYIVDVRALRQNTEIPTWHVVARYSLKTSMKEMKLVALNAVRLGLDTAPRRTYEFQSEATQPTSNSSIA